MKNLLLAIIMICAPFACHAATRDYTVDFTQVCETVDGDSLDQDGDGICEDLNGFRVYHEDNGEFITGIPEDGTRTINFRYNSAWGLSCVKMTSHMTDPIDGSDSESALSEGSVCIEVRPGRPQAPTIR